MSYRMLRLSGLALVVAAGCAGPRMQTVAQAKWQTVPASERAQIDQMHADELAAARKEEQLAATQVVTARQAQAAPTPARKPETEPADLDAHELATWRADARARSAALAQVDHQRAAWLAANVAWHEKRLVAASARVHVVECQIELARAEAVDRHVGDDDTYDTSGYRGQVGHAQEDWYRAEEAVAMARKALDDDAGSLASAKDIYAALVRAGAPVAVVDPSHPWRPAGW